MSKNISLDRCPFCQRKAAHIIQTICLDNDATLYYIYHSTSSTCPLSDIHSKNYGSPEKAARAWNQREPEGNAQPIEEMEEYDLDD